MTCRILSQLLLCAFCAQTSPVFAQASSSRVSSSLSGSLHDEALAAYDAAKLLFEDGDFAGALAKFHRAYGLARDARLLWNMAVCEKELRHYASAARLVAQYLNEAGPGLTSESRQDAESTQAALRGFYSALTLEGLPPDARVSVDGVHVATAPLSGPLPVDLGKRQISIVLPGFEPQEREIEIPGATPVTLQVALKRQKSTATLAVNAGAKDIISFDGKVVGNAAWRGSVLAGTHVVRVTGAGKKPYTKELRLDVGTTRTLDVVLQYETGSHLLWPWIAGGAAVLVGAGIGGYFALKPEHDPGPSGALGRVYLPLGL